MSDDAIKELLRPFCRQGRLWSSRAGDIAFTEQSKSYLGWKTSYRECAAEIPCKVKALAKLRNKSEAFSLVLTHIPPAGRVQPWYFDQAALENRKKCCKLIASRAKEARSAQQPLLCDES